MYIMLGLLSTLFFAIFALRRARVPGALQHAMALRRPGTPLVLMAAST